MTALAEILAPHVRITGSDTEEVFFTDTVLKKLRIPVSRFDAAHITPEISRIIYSSAYATGNVELQAAKRLGIPTMPYAEALAEVFNKHQGVAVVGTHGKTTTTAMIGTVLEVCGVDPTVLVGAKVVAWGRNARVGKSDWMVAEADEYQNKFLLLKPHVLIITNIEYDHPDFFKNRAAYRRAFQELIRRMPKDGVIIAERHLAGVIKHPPCKILWYGLRGEVRGRYMELNGEAALTLARYLKLNMKKSRAALLGYKGTARRLELYTSPKGRTVVFDDYAHHPTEIRASLSMIRRRYPKRHVIAVFQPHTFSRTQALLREFARAFGDANEVLLIPVYASARESTTDFPPDIMERLVQETKKNHKHAACMESQACALHYLRARLGLKQKEELVVVTMGAGDVWQVARDLALPKKKRQ